MARMDPEPAFDPDRILRVLDQHRVDFVLVGGVAARAHGATRATADIACPTRNTKTSTASQLHSENSVPDFELPACQMTRLENYLCDLMPQHLPLSVARHG